MAEDGLPKQYVYLGVLFLIMFIILSLLAGYTLLLIMLEVVSSLFVVFFIYGVLVGGIQSRFDDDEGIGDINYEKGDLRRRISHRIKRFRDKIFYKY